MKILIVNTVYYPRFVGGAEISVQLLAETLVAKGNQVYVLWLGTTNRVYRNNGVIVVEMRERNIYRAYSGRQYNALLKMLWHLIDTCNIVHYISFSKILSKIKPELVNTNNIQGISPIIWKAVKKRNIKLIHTTRDYYLICHKSKLFNNGQNCDNLCLACSVTHGLKKRYFHLPDYFIGISDFILNRYKRFGVIKAESKVIHNPVPAIAIDKPKKSVNSLQIVFGFIGGVTDNKGVGYIVDELIKTKDTVRKKIKMVFAGKGDADFIKGISDKLANADIAFEFKGVVKQVDFFPEIDVLLVPSLWNEPFGRVVVEALSYSVPVCMSDRGGLKELYNPDCCWIFEPSTNSMKNVIEGIVEDVPSIMAKSRVSKKYADEFSIGKIYNETRTVFNDVLDIDSRVL